MAQMSLRKMAKAMGITPAYLSMMVNGKRPWSVDFRERYELLVNSVDTSQESVNKLHPDAKDRQKHAFIPLTDFP